MLTCGWETTGSPFVSLGPNSGIVTGSLVIITEHQNDYIMAAIETLRRERPKTNEVKTVAIKEIDENLEHYFPHAGPSRCTVRPGRLRCTCMIRRSSRYGARAPYCEGHRPMVCVHRTEGQRDTVHVHRSEGRRHTVQVHRTVRGSGLRCPCTVLRGSRIPCTRTVRRGDGIRCRCTVL
ncbi:hypothetical protein JB92DRAFT_773611 [Gautieria morchelliformis]|nr:hypothetical protein JB92DRAFT_773611 [Gautieria morchelliformis]